MVSSSVQTCSRAGNVESGNCTSTNLSFVPDSEYNLFSVNKANELGCSTIIRKNHVDAKAERAIRTIIESARASLTSGECLCGGEHSLARRTTVVMEWNSNERSDVNSSAVWQDCTLFSLAAAFFLVGKLECEHALTASRYFGTRLKLYNSS